MCKKPLTGILLGLAVFGCVFGDELTVQLSDPSVAVPIDHSARHLDVEVMIDGQGPYPFQVDTYASIDACIDDDLARQLGLRKTGTTQNSDGHTTRERDLVIIDELQLGGATFTNLTALVDDYDFLENAQGQSVRGLIGFTAFADLLLTVDYPGSQLILATGRLDPDDPHVIPFTTPSGAPDIAIGFVGPGDEPVELIVGIDTGAGSGLALTMEDAERLELSSELRRVGTSRTVYSEFAVHGAVLAGPLDLAGHRLEGVEPYFGEGRNSRQLGHGLMRDFEVTFDQRSGLVRFVRPGLAGALDRR